jgi:probable phosphoglycerate mutase
VLQLLLIRHAEPAYPAYALTARGRRQARALAARLAATGVDRLVSSPMERALATARPAAEATGLELAVEPWLAELEGWAIDDPRRGEAPAWELDAGALRSLPEPPDRDGWHRLPPLAAAGLAAGWRALRRDSDAFLATLGHRREGGRYRVDGGPQARVDSESQKLVDGALQARADGTNPARVEQVAAICHAGLALTWLAHLLELPPPAVWAGFTLPPSSVTTVVFEPGEPGWAVPRCVGLGDLSHLAAALPDPAADQVADPSSTQDERDGAGAVDA